MAWGITCLAALFGTTGAIRGNMQEVTEHVEISSLNYLRPGMDLKLRRFQIPMSVRTIPTGLFRRIL